MATLRSAALCLVLTVTSGIAWLGCSSNADDGDSGDQAAVAGGDCQIFSVKDQANIDLAKFGRKDDPVVKKILAGGCPQNYREIQTKLTKAQPCNLEVRNVSERAVQLGHGEAGRALVSRTCGSSDPELFFLLDPIDTRKTSEVPNDVEVIGNTNGVFSFYAREPKSKTDPTVVWKFYGTSEDFVSNGYDCSDKFNGACQPLFAQDNGVKGNKSGVRCASCHPGGGLVQKELNSPWTSWQNPPAADAYAKANADILGTLNDGLSFEPVTTALNTKWAKKRISILKAKGVQELLRPLFCTIDINLQAAGGTTVADDFFVDPIFSTGASANLDASAYKKALGDNDQKIGGTGMSSKKDTSDIFMYPERSQLDQAYIEALKSEVGEEFVRDVLFVDFTRPIYSPTRCGLIEAADGVTSLSSAPEQIRKNALAKKLDGAQELDDAMNSKEKGNARHQTEVGAYLTACSQRSDAAFAGEVVRYASHLRRAARQLRVKIAVEKTKDRSDNPTGDFGIIDFPETLPTDKFDQQSMKQPAFSKDKCQLQE